MKMNLPDRLQLNEWKLKVDEFNAPTVGGGMDTITLKKSDSIWVIEDKVFVKSTNTRLNGNLVVCGLNEVFLEANKALFEKVI